jgi:cell division protein FtsA
MVREKLDKLNLTRPLGGGVVLSGGGARLPGVEELANAVLKLPTRVGGPIPSPGIVGLAEEYRGPAYATAVGLLLEGNDREGQSDSERGVEPRQGDKGQATLFEKLRLWLEEFF